VQQVGRVVQDVVRDVAVEVFDKVLEVGSVFDGAADIGLALRNLYGFLELLGPVLEFLLKDHHAEVFVEACHHLLYDEAPGDLPEGLLELLRFLILGMEGLLAPQWEGSVNENADFHLPV
jgi:hypothetical protein